ncbi:MAG TPA: DedA family protein, partial [Candidatus Paceibacterota bacterium]|nr:DedA family protein [Candidatus Paceibacterota bacterium]
MEGPIVNFLYENIDVFSTLGLLIVFAISFLESTPFFGLIVPTQTILVIGGFLTKISGSSFGDIFLIAVAGSIAGDIASFYAGRKFGPDILTKYGSKFLIKKEYVEKTGALLDEHLGKTLFIGRLSAIPRSIAPFLAGSSGINFFRFLAWVTAGAVLWSLVFIGAGFVFAQSYDVLGPAIGKFIYSAIAIAIFMLAV